MSVFALKRSALVARIADLESQLDSLRAKLAVVKELEAEFDGEDLPASVPAPTPVAAEVMPGKESARPGRKPVLSGERETQIVRMLKEVSPGGLAGGTIAERLDANRGSVNRLLKQSRLFMRREPSWGAPWVLTEEGEAKADSLLSTARET